MATNNTRRSARTPSNLYADERYKLMGLNMVMPDQLISNGESPYTINTRMYAREIGDKRVAIRTRKGPGFYSVPVGETLRAQQITVTGAANQTLNQSRRQASSFVSTASGPLTAIDLNLKSNTGIGTVVIEVRMDNAGLPGDLLARSATTGSSIVSTYSYVKFRFINPAIVTNATKYWVVAYAQDDATNFFHISSTAAASTGALSINGGGSYTSQSYALNIKTYVSDTGAIKGWKRQYYSNGTTRTIFAHGTTLYYVNDVNGLPVVIKTGLSSAATRYRFVKFNDKTVVINGYDQPFTVDSALVIETLTNVPFIPDKMAVWKNRIYFTQINTDSTRVFFSEVNDINNYPPVNFFNVPAPKSADPITALLVFQDNLIIFTGEAKYIYYGDGSISGSSLRQAIGTKGAVSQEAVTNDRNFAYFVSDDQIYRFNGATDDMISDKVQIEVDSFADRSKASLCLYDNKLRVYYPRAGQAQNNGMLLLDNVYTQWFMDTDAYTDMADIFNQDPGNPLVEASSVYGALFYAEVAFNNLGAPIDFKYWTPYNKYLSAMSKDRTFRFHPQLRPGSFTYYMSIGKDVDFRNSPSMVPYIVESGGSIWGAPGVTWGGSGIQWGGNEYLDRKISLSGRGQHTQYRFERYGANTPVEIYGYGALIKSSRMR